MKPKLEHYPKWLREYIYPEINQRGWDHQNNYEKTIEALHHLVFKSRTDPESRILFEVVLEGIRTKFKMYALEVKCIELDSQIKELKTAIKTEKKPRKKRDSK
jgi:hypothetical protein